MTLFQILTLGGLGLLLLREAAGLWRQPEFGIRWVRALVWLCAGVAIAWPNLTQQLANAVGITRGADLVFYFFVLAFLATTFYFYSRMVRLQRQVTQLVRHLALHEAQRGSSTPVAAEQDTIVS
jgi:hypothetical protein